MFEIFDTFDIVEKIEIETRSELINIYFFLRRSSSWVTILIPSLTSLQSSRLTQLELLLISIFSQTYDHQTGHK